jgi:hypothetical protein
MKIKKLSRLNFKNLGVRNFLSGSVYLILTLKNSEEFVENIINKKESVL